jgi:small subunit ribosomal protein S9
MADTKVPQFCGTGRRKTAVAQVRVMAGSGKILVNGRAFDNYFPTESLRTTAVQPLTLTGNTEKFDVFVNVRGGGPTGQAGAVRHGLSRALLRVDANLRPALKSEGLLTRDPRMRERKKYGQPGARKRFQYSKR